MFFNIKVYPFLSMTSQSAKTLPDILNSKRMEETEQMSLTINGRKNKLTKKDFDSLGFSLSLNEKQILNTYKQFLRKLDKAHLWIENSFISNDQKQILSELIVKRISLLNN